jgi:hypothetical protein
VASFSSKATANPVSLKSGSGMETIAATISTGQAATALVDIEVYNSSGVRVSQQWFDNQSFAAGQSKTYTITYTPGPVGTYTVKVGVFSPGWGTSLNWNDNAASFAVTP